MTGLTLNDAAQLKERLKAFDHLRITEDKAGLHVYNIPIQADMCLYREPRNVNGYAVYGHVIYEESSVYKYLLKKQFDYALQLLFRMDGQAMTETE